MPPRLRFRHRIGALVALAAAGLATVTVVTLVLGRRSEHELAGIETRYVPLIELDRDLKSTFAQTTRAFEDAASAAEEGGLAQADKLASEFVERLHTGRDAIVDNGDDPVALERDFQAYFALAREVSSAIVGGAQISELEAKIDTMRRLKRTVAAHLDVATTPDRRRLASAFATARDSQAEALRIEIVVALGALLSMGLLSWRLTRRTVRSLQEVSTGVERLADGEFAHEIHVETDDEIGDLAREANRTATRLREYHDHTQSLLTQLAEANVMEQRRAEAAIESAQELRRAKDAAETASRELESFSYSVAHDLRAPLRGINGFSAALIEDLADKLGPEARGHLDRISAGAARMGHLIDALLGLARVSRTDLAREPVNLTRMAHDISVQLAANDPARTVEWVIAADLETHGDPHLLRVLLENLLGNAWKFASKRESAHIELGRDDRSFFVRDNGAGFDMAYAEKLFTPFQRLHSAQEFAGTGIGLATVQRIVQRHGGRIWADGVVGEGATFHFTLAAA